MVRRSASARPATLGALFAFLTAVVVTVFGVVPSSAATTRQPGTSGDPTATAARDADLGPSLSIAAPDDADDDFHVPGPVGTPAAELPDLPSHPAATPASPTRPIAANGPESTRGRAPPR
jgi:hypothetical protein